MVYVIHLDFEISEGFRRLMSQHFVTKYESKIQRNRFNYCVDEYKY